MISLKTEIPPINLPLAEAVKINCLYACYPDITLFWVQNDGDAVIAMLDGNMTVFNKSADIDELYEFINVIAPNNIFSDADTLTALFGDTFHRVCVMTSDKSFECDMVSGTLTSDQMYKLLSVEGLSIPDYQYFAVDFCHRLRCGSLKYFALKEKCAAIAFFDGQAVLINGIVSHQKGMGSIALCGVLSNFKNQPAVAVCEKDVMPFYIKNDFHHSYDAGYWRKNT